MPRSSMRKKLLVRLDQYCICAAKQIRIRYLLSVPYSEHQHLFILCRSLKKKISSSRYLNRPTTYRKRKSKFEIYLDPESDDGLSEKEFKFHFRISRTAFTQIVQLLKDHVAFKRKSSTGPLPKCPSHQLLVLMKYYGCQGNAASSVGLSSFFGVGAGVIDRCRENALVALLSLEDRTYYWPDEEERRKIASRIKRDYLFPNCVGLIDGTLLPLSERPILHGENYMSRKRFYAIVMLVVCDDEGRILYYHIGWPGSVHDNRVWRNCKLFKESSNMFSRKEYLLGDSAFTASQVMIPPFKTNAGSFLPSSRSAFNTLLSKPRVKSEHCIGILKGRFPYLRCIRQKLGKASHMARIINYVRGTVILHNFLLGDSEDYTCDDAEGEDDLQPETRRDTTAASNQADYRRRDELYYYLSELEGATIN